VLDPKHPEVVYAALYARLPLLERFIPLPLVETGHVAAALAGLLLLTLARGLGRGYRAAFRFTLDSLGKVGTLVCP
jgi:lysylphosphatidylglycerol synthetase-like protein (DUF2156 family)